MFFSFFPVIIVISILFGRALEFESLRIIAENLEALLPKEIMGIINNYIDFAVSENGDNVLYISVFFTFYFPFFTFIPMKYLSTISYLTS